jgi:hypothetical protein
MKEYNIDLVKIDQNSGSSHPSYFYPYVHCVNVERGAAVLTYHVFVGPFVVNVKVLNIDEDINNNSEITTLKRGCFGSIIAQNDGNEQFVAKRITFWRKLYLMSTAVDEIDWVLTGTYSEVRDAVIEYSFVKVCSLLKIGPKIKIGMGFDLVCSHTSIEFYMEQCEQVEYRP